MHSDSADFDRVSELVELPREFGDRVREPVKLLLELPNLVAVVDVHVYPEADSLRVLDCGTNDVQVDRSMVTLAAGDKRGGRFGVDNQGLFAHARTLSAAVTLRQECQLRGCSHHAAPDGPGALTVESSIMWEPYPDLDASQTMAIGRLTWAAIKLDGVVVWICRKVPKAPYKPGQDRGQFVKATMKANPNPSASLRAAFDWMAEAARVLERRNKVLHAESVAFLDPEGLRLDNGTLLNQRGGTTYTSLSPEALDDITRAIEDVYRGWREADLQVISLA